MYYIYALSVHSGRISFFYDLNGEKALYSPKEAERELAIMNQYNSKHTTYHKVLADG